MKLINKPKKNSNKQNVLLITVRSDFGGGPRHITQLIRYLPSNINLFMAFPLNGQPYAPLWTTDKRIMKYISIPYRKFSIFALIKLILFCRMNNINIIHSHGQGAGIYSRLLKIFNPHIYIIHTFHGVTNNYNSTLKKWLNSFVNTSLRSLTNWFICVSEGEKDKALQMHFIKESHTSIIYNGIEQTTGYHVKLQNKIIKIVTLSRFDFQKNMHMAFNIAEKLHNKKNIQFIWIGDGPEKEELENLACKKNINNISFMGFSETPAKFLSDADIYLSTSRFEGLPYALIEACEMGLPIIATNVTGNNEVCRNNYNGILFNTIDEGVKAIIDLIESPHLYLTYSKHSRLLYESLFTIKKMIKSISDIYKQF